MMKHMVFAASFVLIGSCLGNDINVRSESSSYALSVGYDDLERLRYLHAAIVPYSRPFTEHHVKAGDRVLDLGAGIGLMSQELAQQVGKTGKVIAVDNSDKQLKIAKQCAGEQYPNLHFVNANAYDLSSIQGKFDVVYARFLFIHLRHPEQALKEAKGKLKKGGILLIEDLLGNGTILSVPADNRLDYVNKTDDMQEQIQATDFAIAKRLPTLMQNNGFIIEHDAQIHPVLDILEKRRNFSLGMQSLRKALLTHNKINEAQLNRWIVDVQALEEDMSKKLYFYKMGQIAGRLR